MSTYKKSNAMSWSIDIKLNTAEALHLKFQQWMLESASFEMLVMDPELLN